jgi:hypothetical protein
MDDDIDDKDDTKRYVFFLMIDKFHVYLLKPRSVKGGEIKWIYYISFKKEEHVNHRSYLRTREIVCHGSIEKVY